MCTGHLPIFLKSIRADSEQRVSLFFTWVSDRLKVIQKKGTAISETKVSETAVSRAESEGATPAYFWRLRTPRKHWHNTAETPVITVFIGVLNIDNYLRLFNKVDKWLYNGCINVV